MISHQYVRLRFSILTFFCCAGLLLAACSLFPGAAPQVEPTPAPTQGPDETAVVENPTDERPAQGGEGEPGEPPAGVIEARDRALAYIVARYSEPMPVPEADWQIEDTTPEGLVGSSSFRFSAGEVVVEVSYPIVAPENEIYRVSVSNPTSSFHWEGEVNPAGLVIEKSVQLTGVPVQGWLGYVVSTPEGSEYDDYVIFVPEGSGEAGISGVDEAVEARIANLRDHDEPGKYANFWGTMNCDVPDYGGCQLRVTKLRTGAEQVEPERVNGWTGRIYSHPDEAQFDDYFVLEGDFSIQFGISSFVAENGLLVYADEIANLRDSGQVVTVYGILVCGVPDTNGCQIQVDYMEVDGVAVDRYQGWESYNDSQYGFSFRYPPNWTLELGPEPDPDAEQGPRFTRTIYLDQGDWRIYIGFHRADEEDILGGTGLPSGELVQRGAVSFFSLPMLKKELVLEDKVKALYYGPAEVENLVFVVRLDYRGSDDYAEIDIPSELSMEVDQILGSFGLTQ